MGLFRKKVNPKNRCTDCKSYVMLEGYGFCSKDVSSDINVRMLSGPGIRRLCVRCPEAMTCDDWAAKA